VESKEIMERLLELSEQQREFFEQNRYPELLKAQADRAELFEQLDKFKGEGEGEDKAKLLELRDKLLASDKELTLRMNAEMDGLRGKLKKVARGSQALKAYAGRANK